MMNLFAKLTLLTVAVWLPVAAQSLPEPAERAAEVPDSGGMTMAGHMDDDPFNAMLLVDRLEWQDNVVLAWDVSAWAGRDENKLWLRGEGEHVDGQIEHAALELLWSRPLSRWWDWLAGLRHDAAPGAGQAWAALGVQGLAPYKFEVQATLYLGASGRTAARVEAEYELLLTQRLILQPRVEVNLYGRSDIARGVGSGLDDIAAGLRLRYELRREFAPYVGVERIGRFGNAAAFVRERVDEDAWETRFVAGFRIGL